MLAGVLTSGIAGCGLPPAPDLRGQMTEAVSRLGVQPVYPLTETLRLGSVHLVDAGRVSGRGGLAPQHEPSVLLTEYMVERFDKEWRNRFALRERLPQSPANLGTARDPGPTGQTFYVQSAAPSGEVPEKALPLAAMPGYSLASVDQAAIGAVVPDVIASVFAAMGLRRTSSMRVQALGVEIAELPLDTVRRILALACTDGAFLAEGTATVAEAFNILAAQRAGVGGRMDARLALVRRVFYLRGIRFIIDDSRAAAAFAQAAIANPVAPGRSQVTLPQVTVNTMLSGAPPAPVPPGGTPPPAPPPNSAAARAAAQDAAIAALAQQLETLRTQLGRDGNIQVGASLARATATGVELDQLFDRPLAFGYQALFVRPAADQSRPVNDANPPTGMQALCDRVPLRVAAGSGG